MGTEHPCGNCLWRSSLPPLLEDLGEPEVPGAQHWCAHYEFYGWVAQGMRCAGKGQRFRAEAERS